MTPQSSPWPWRVGIEALESLNDSALVVLKGSYQIRSSLHRPFLFPHGQQRIERIGLQSGSYCPVDTFFCSQSDHDRRRFPNQTHRFISSPALSNALPRRRSGSSVSECSWPARNSVHTRSSEHKPSIGSHAPQVPRGFSAVRAGFWRWSFQPHNLDLDLNGIRK